MLESLDRPGRFALDGLVRKLLVGRLDDNRHRAVLHVVDDNFVFLGNGYCLFEYVYFSPQVSWFGLLSFHKPKNNRNGLQFPV